jgi:hypothetical protein
MAPEVQGGKTAYFAEIIRLSLRRLSDNIKKRHLQEEG